MDEADQTQQRIEAELEQAMKLKRPALPFTGYCYNCAEMVDTSHKFCDADCMADWEHRQESRKRNGK